MTKRGMAGDILDVVKQGTSKWTRTIKAEERRPAAASFRMSRMTRQKGVSLKDAAAEIMERAYLKASGDGTLPANARQIMYAARPHIQEATGKDLDDNYFTQVLLPDYIDQHSVRWDVVYDARGHFNEPRRPGFGISTLEVRRYLTGMNAPIVNEARFSGSSVSTTGPDGSFGAVLFIEKEGFDPILKAARIAEKFDLAIMSTKGVSVTAARLLADRMCDRYDIPLLVLHDFDKAGFSIAGTLRRDTRRYRFENEIEVIDLGLSLEDVEAMGLEHEYQHHGNTRREAIEANLRQNGASPDDVTYMLSEWAEKGSTRRVELNAMSSPQFVEFVEDKLTGQGIEKVIPGEDLLAKAYASAKRARRVEEATKSIIQSTSAEDSVVPADLKQRVRALLDEDPTLRWDEAVRTIAAPDPEARQ